MAEKAEEEPTKFDVAFGELLTVIDRNYDDYISLSELQKAFPEAGQTFFSSVDVNEDGKIGVADLRKVFVLADGSEDLDRVQKLTAELAKGLEERFYAEFWKLVTLLDKNYDDNISLSEFSAMYPAATTSFFKELDQDQNDQLSAAELEAMFTLADGTYDINRVVEISDKIREEMFNVFNAEFKQLLVFVDKNEDNKISINEFTGMYPGAHAGGMFNSLDINHDEQLNIPEFRKLFKLADGTYDTPQVKELNAKIGAEKMKQKA